jgi:DTW domain-containing protein YfiP
MKAGIPAASRGSSAPKLAASLARSLDVSSTLPSAKKVREAGSTLRSVRSSLRFAPEALAALLQRPGWDTRLLYPDVPAAPAPSAPQTAALAPVRLVVIDATWRKSLRMLLEHPALAALPRLSLDAPAPSCYGAIRVARRADQVSTLEATVQALAMLEGPSFNAAPLLDAFSRFVAGVAFRVSTPPARPDTA